jgi:hypothetical protein
MYEKSTSNLMIQDVLRVQITGSMSHAACLPPACSVT